MPATRSSTRLAVQRAASSYEPPANRRSAKASKPTPNATKDVDNSAASSHAATTVLARKKRTMEKCTEQQTAELERLYILAERYPTAKQNNQIAQDIGK
jgi:hypothetical protein